MLKLGGTIAPWYEADLKTGWITKGKCGKSELKNIIDFKPLFNHLFESYNYVWIYGAWGSDV